MEKYCIIFDNEDQSDEIEKMVREAKRNHGITLICEQFSVGSTEQDQFLTDGKIDMEKVVNEFKNLFQGGSKFHLAAFDWDLGDDSIDGVELIRILTSRNILLRTPKLLYSGLLEDKLSGQLSEFKKGTVNKTVLLKKIKALIKIDIKDFVERDHYDKVILGLLKISDDSLDFLLEKQLSYFPHLKFQNRFISNDFQGKTFQQILNIIETDDRLRNELKKEILGQVVAYISEAYS